MLEEALSWERLDTLMAGDGVILDGGDHILVSPTRFFDLFNHFPKCVRSFPSRFSQALQRRLRPTDSEITVKDKEIRIRGSRKVLARAASHDLMKIPPEVLSFVRDWYA